MMRKRRWLALALLLALLCACAARPADEESTINLYYRRQSAQAENAFQAETGALAAETTTFAPDTAPQTLLDRYLRGPRSETLASIFPEGLGCTCAGVEDGVLTLEVSEAFSQLSGVSRTLALAGLTLTLTQLDGVEALELQAPGNALSGQNQTRWTRADFLLQDTSWQHPERVVQLYFAGQSGALCAEVRTISYLSQELLPQSALEALLQGPESQELSACIPAGSEILDISLSGTLCTVTLSMEFSACDTDRTRAALAVRSIAATLCSLSEIEQVQLVIDGVDDLQYYSIAAPLSPESSWYE